MKKITMSNLYGTMRRQNKHASYSVSRDWKDITCKATGCRYNQNEKCTVPSIAIINKTGGCTGFTLKELKTVNGD